MDGKHGRDIRGTPDIMGGVSIDSPMYTALIGVPPTNGFVDAVYTYTSCACACLHLSASPKTLRSFAPLRGFFRWDGLVTRWHGSTSASPCDGGGHSPRCGPREPRGFASRALRPKIWGHPGHPSLHPSFSSIWQPLETLSVAGVRWYAPVAGVGCCAWSYLMSRRPFTP